MSASAPSTEPCPDCHSELPRGARYCPTCGSDLGAATVVPHESPIEYAQIERRWLGVPPPYLLLGAIALMAVAALVLFATGLWPYGLIVLGIAALVAAGSLEAIKRGAIQLGPSSTNARDRVQAAVETWRLRAATAQEVQRTRSALALLESRRRALHERLGAAVYRGDDIARADALRGLGELDGQETELRERLDRSLDEAGAKIRQTRLEVEQTVMVLPEEPEEPETP